MSAVIKCIAGHEPAREGEYPLSFTVGYDGVTRISYHTEHYGDHGIGEFSVYKGEELAYRMTHRAVAEIHYFHGSDEIPEGAA